MSGLEAFLGLPYRQLTSGGQGETQSPEAPDPASIFSVHTLGSMNDMGFFWILLIFLAKHGQAARVAEILQTIVHDAFGSLQQYARSGAANRVSAWGSGFLVSCVLERFGFITQGQASGFSMGNNAAAAIDMATGIVDQIGDIFPKLNLEREDDGFPDQITMADTVYNVMEHRSGEVELVPFAKKLANARQEGRITLEAKTGGSE